MVYPLCHIITGCTRNLPGQCYYKMGSVVRVLYLGHHSKIDFKCLGKAQHLSHSRLHFLETTLIFLAFASQVVQTALPHLKASIYRIVFYKHELYTPHKFQFSFWKRLAPCCRVRLDVPPTCVCRDRQTNISQGKPTA